MRALFAEVRRVLADDGTLWLNLGDSYAGASSASRSSEAISTPASISASPLSPSSADSHSDSADLTRFTQSSSTGPVSGMKQGARNGNRRSRPRGYEGIPQKSMLGIPWRVAFALQDDGWILRNEIIWSKPNAMPESVTDRLSSRHEHLFMLTKSRRYWFDLDPIREDVVYPPGAPALSWARDSKEADVPGQSMRQHRSSRTHGKAESAALAPTGKRHDAQNPRGKNPGDVWSIATQPFPGAHFAVMPPELARRCVVAGCKPGGTVLDPFSGSGTTGLVAQQVGRKYVGIDLNADYLDLSLRTRLNQGALDLEEGA